MKIVGLITEYNPFHNGHEYHIQKALEVTGADAALVLMSGDFVQRGAPAVFPKHLRAKTALLNGAAAVLELPVCYACGSAEYFARGAVTTLDALQCVDMLCFGSECGDLDSLSYIAHILADEPSAYRALLSDYLKAGLSFPAARQMALASFTEDEDLAQLLASPNNILGIEYLKALHQLGSHIKPYTIERIDAGYHAQELSGTYSSASAIRSTLESSGDMTKLRVHMPGSAYELLYQANENQGPVYPDDFSLLLKYKLLSETKESLSAYADVTIDLANRILNRRNSFLSWTQFCDLLKTKEVTYSRISRALLHILLDVRSSDMELFCTEETAIYARLLGFRQSDGALLRDLKQNSGLPLLTKLTQAELSPAATRMLELDIHAANIYQSVVTNKYQTPFINEYEQQVCIIM